MNPTDILMDEHRVIEQVLNCLEKIIEQATAAGGWRKSLPGKPSTSSARLQIVVTTERRKPTYSPSCRPEDSVAAVARWRSCCVNTNWGVSTSVEWMGPSNVLRKVMPMPCNGSSSTAKATSGFYGSISRRKITACFLRRTVR